MKTAPLCLALGLWLATATAVGASASPGQAEQVLTLSRADMVVVIDGQAQPMRTVELPLHWDVMFEGRSGQVDLALSFTLPPHAVASNTSYALFIARLGVAYEITVNGEVVARAGSITQRDRWFAKHPVHVNLPAKLLRPGTNQLQLRLRADAGYRAGLSPVIVGPAELVKPIVRQAQWLRVTLPQGAAVFSLLVAGFCALLWWQQRDPLYAWAALGETVWAISVADTVIEEMPLPWPYWGVTLLALRAVWIWSIYAIAEQVFGRRPQLERHSMVLVVAGVPLCVLAMALLQSTRPLLVWYLFNFSFWTWVILALGAQVLKAASSQRVLIWLAIAGVYVASLRDVVAGRLVATLYDESAWAKYVAVLVGAALMWIVSQRFNDARLLARSTAASLAEQVRRKEYELRASFELLAKAEHAGATLDERQRILRDMHDGLGANLATALRLVESCRATNSDLARTLREALDQLKLMVDAMTLPAGDVNALLAGLRYRLAPRLEAAGLEIDWDVATLAHWPAGEAERQMRGLQSLLFEAFSNALQHSGATRLLLSARNVAGPAIEIIFQDNGRGLGARAQPVLKAIHERAASIAAPLELTDAAPGLRLTLRLATA